MVEGQSSQQVTCLSWNNEGTNLAVGLSHGFIIYSTELLLEEDGWLHEVLQRPIIGGVGVMALHGQGNIILIAGWTPSHRSTVSIYDLTIDEMQEGRESILASVTLFSPVTALRFHPRLIMVGESNQVHLFDHSLKKVHSFTVSKKAMISIGNVKTMALGTILVKKPAAGVCFSLLLGVIPGPSIGSVRCIRYVADRQLDTLFSQLSPTCLTDMDVRPLSENIIEIHRNEVHCITITPDGTRALTVSERGTSLKLLDVENGIVLSAFSRGKTPNLVHTLGLLVSSTDTVAACVSDTGTFHLFHIPIVEGLSNRLPISTGTEGGFSDTKIFKAFNDYINSMNAKARLTIPDDGLYDNLCKYRDYNRSMYTLALRPMVNKTSSCIAHVVQWNVSQEGLALKARLLSIQIDLSATMTGESVKVIRTFYFPKDEL
ncbi:uncharacterized protein TM35_000084180 [Trypanosoma theileri]|uniref:Uncharacterized protein n=1 Tax=Trypanosoma theileri TaxID=67003 RepID=A0A1X0P2K4_9TRYP|nr:uncharacterized protein TM35_000084180 [Trypanosoma theileri]ORC90620.1 hypothetical protein TM35_000084180 [Trypanosoma theileri]